MTGPRWTLSDDQKTLTISFPSDPPVALQIDTAQVEDLLRNVGLYRASMLPQVPMDFEMGQKVEAVPDPKWGCEPDLLQGHSLLHLRDPRFGWVHYLLPKHEARKLAGILKNQSEAPAPTTVGKPS